MVNHPRLFVPGFRQEGWRQGKTTQTRIRPTACAKTESPVPLLRQLCKGFRLDSRNRIRVRGNRDIGSQEREETAVVHSVRSVFKNLAFVR